MNRNVWVLIRFVFFLVQQHAHTRVLVSGFHATSLHQRRQQRRLHHTNLLASISASSRAAATPDHNDDDNWDVYFEHYVNYTQTTGQCNVPLNHSLLGNWVRTQRRQYKQQSKQNQQQQKLARLHRAGFVFDAVDHAWMSNYHELQEYYEIHGHCRVPHAHATALGRWVQSQRYKQKRGTLEHHRIQLLNDLEFCWNPREWTFRTRVRQVLLALNSETQHNNKKTIWDWKITDGDLGLWVCRQRTNYRKYLQQDAITNQNVMPHYQVELLETQLGFFPTMFDGMRPLPRPPTQNLTWSDYMAQLEAYSKQHGHVNVPRTVHPLGTWVAKVRERYRTIGPHSSEIMQQRFNDLVEIQFIWDVCEHKWQLKFQELVQFYHEYGHVHVPDSYSSLGPWVKEQRREYRKIRQGDASKLTPRHAMALHRIGLDWNRQATVKKRNDDTFRRRCQEYEQYMMVESTATTVTDGRKKSKSVASMPKELRNWVERYRKLYRRDLALREQPHEDDDDDDDDTPRALSNHRRQLLEEAGVVSDIQPSSL